MKKNTVSEFVASQMDGILKSASHKALFEGRYKSASEYEDDQDARKKKMKACEDCDKEKDECACDSSLADDQDARKKKVVKEDEGDMKSSASFDLAIDGLLSASAALDAVGMEKTATLSLQLASLVVEAKKKDSKDKLKEKAEKAKAKEQFFKAKEKEAKEKDVQMAKDKASKLKAKEKAEKDMQAAKDKAAKVKAKEKADKEAEKAKADKK